jgi:ATP-binding cassette, subfamily B, bacterial
MPARYNTAMSKSVSNVRRLAPFIWPQRYVFASAFSCTAGFVLSMPVLAYLAERLAKFISEEDLDSITDLTRITIAVFIVRGLFQFGQDALMAKASLQAVMELRNQVFAHVQTLDMAYFMRVRAGDLAYLLTTDVDRLTDAVRRFFGQVIPSILTSIVVIAYLIYLNPALTLLTLTVAPLLGFTLGFFGQQLRDLSRDTQDLASDLSATLTEIFGGIRVIQGFAAEGYEIRRFAAKSEAKRASQLKSEQLKAIQFPVGGFLQAMSVVLVIWVGGWQIISGNLTGSQLVGFFAGIGLLIDPVVLITINFNELKQVESSADRLFELLDVEPQIKEIPQAQALPSVQGKVELRGIWSNPCPCRPLRRREIFSNIAPQSLLGPSVGSNSH